MAKLEANIVVDVMKAPELIAGLRKEMADMLREEADGEPQIVKRKLEALAAAFEVGSRG